MAAIQGAYVKIVLLSFSVGAMGHYVAGMANPLAECGHDVVVFVDDETPVSCFHKDVVVKRCEIPQFFSFSSLVKLIYMPVIIFQIKSFVKKWNPDIIHFNSSHWYFRFLTCLIRYAPTIVTIHDVYAHPGTSEKIEEFKKKPMITKCSAIVVHSEILKQQALKKWDISDSRIKVVPFNIVGLNNWLDYLDSSEMSCYDFKKLLFFGRIREYKGLDILLKSFEGIKKEIPDAQLIIAGQGEFKMPENKDNIVLINEFLSDQNAAKIIAESAVLVAPYIEATISTLPTIAGIFAKPIIGSDIYGIKEFVDNGKTGLLVEPNDVKALTSACVELLNSPEKCREMGELAREANKKMSAPSTIADNLITLYKSCVQSV